MPDPYILTFTDHNWPCGCDHGRRRVSERAFAPDELEGRLNLTVGMFASDGEEADALFAQVNTVMAENGGVIGPFADDGTTIEVQQVTSLELRRRVQAMRPMSDVRSWGVSRLLDTFNAS